MKQMQSNKQVEIKERIKKMNRIDRRSIFWDSQEFWEDDDEVEFIRRLLDFILIYLLEERLL